MISGQKCLPEAELVAGKFGSPALVTMYNVQSSTQIIRPLARFYSYDYDLHKTNYIFKWLFFKEIER